MSSIIGRVSASPVIDASATERQIFLKRTYGHLLGAVAGFVGIQAILIKTGIAEKMLRMVAQSRFSWMLLLGGFMVVGWFASRTAHQAKSLGAQYAALAGYVVAEALIFAPIILIANRFAPGAISSAAAVTLVSFAALTAIVVITGKDFSFLGSILRWAGILALVAIGGSFIFGAHLGTWFSVAMVAFAGGAILFDTSNIMRHYPTDRYVGASLELFGSVALLFWYILQLFMSQRD